MATFKGKRTSSSQKSEEARDVDTLVRTRGSRLSQKSDEAKGGKSGKKSKETELLAQAENETCVDCGIDVSLSKKMRFALVPMGLTFRRIEMRLGLLGGTLSRMAGTIGNFPLKKRSTLGVPSVERMSTP